MPLELGISLGLGLITFTFAWLSTKTEDPPTKSLFFFLSLILANATTAIIVINATGFTQLIILAVLSVTIISTSFLIFKGMVDFIRGAVK